MKLLKYWWCKLFHRQAMWPMHGRVRCAVCLLEEEACIR